MVNSSTQIGSVQAFKVYDISDVANLTDSLAADSQSLENAILLGFRTTSKDYFIAKDGIAGKILSYALFEHNTALAGHPLTQGTVELYGTPIPKASVVLPGHFVVQTAYASGGSAQISLGTKKKSDGSNISTTNILAAAVLGTNGTAGNHATLTANLMATTDSDITLSLTTTVADLTAGAGVAYIPYVVPSVGSTAVTYR